MTNRPLKIIVVTLISLVLPGLASAQTPRRGINVPCNIVADDIQTLGEWNVNLVRYQLTWPQFVETASGAEFEAWLAGELADLDKLLPVFEANGIKIILDLHNPPGGFYSGTFPAQFRLFAEAWPRETLTKVWKEMTLRYKGNSAIWAFELVSEPATGQLGNNPLWPEIASALVKEVVALDSTRQIVVAPDYSHYNILKKFARAMRRGVGKTIFEDNLIFSVHLFLPYAYVKQGLDNLKTPVYYPSQRFSAAKIETALARISKIQAKRPRIPNERILVGEFSVVRWAPNAAGYLNDFISMLEGKGWNWAYQIFREDPTWSVEHSADPRDSLPSAEETDRAAVLKGFLANN